MENFRVTNMWEFAHLRIPWKTVEYFWTFLTPGSYNSLRTEKKGKAARAVIAVLGWWQSSWSEEQARSPRLSHGVRMQVVTGQLVLPIRVAELSVPDSRNQPRLATGCKRLNCRCWGANRAAWSMRQKGKFTGQNFQAARWSSVAVLWGSLHPACPTGSSLFLFLKEYLDSFKETGGRWKRRYGSWVLT